MLDELRRSLNLLSARDKLILLLLVAFQFGLALLDLVAIGLLGLVVSTAAASATGETPGFLSRLTGLIVEPPGTRLILLLGIAAGTLMVVKSALSFWGTRRSFRFLANRQAIVAGKLASELLSRPLLQVQRKSSQENAFALTQGTQAMIVGVLGQFIIMSSEAILVTVLLVGLLAVDPILTAFTAGFFISIALALHLLLSRWAVRIGRREGAVSAASTEAIQESLRSYREVTVAGRRNVYTRRFTDLTWDVARVHSDRLMIQAIGKYVFEVALIGGAGLLLLAQITTSNFSQAAATVVVFLAAASRIMPALLRFQSASVMFKLSAGVSHMSAELISDLYESKQALSVGVSELEKGLNESLEGYPTFSGRLSLVGVGVTYPRAVTPALYDISVELPEGESLAIVGPTGAGKSTFADVALGVIEPDVGYVRIGGMAPSEAVRRFPGACAYVPQDVAIANGSVRTNVTMGLPEELVQDGRVWEALERAQLATFLLEAREGLDTMVGEHGVKLSGGQRQRLGIARALYTRPRLLVLDEATSALDAETEVAITETLSALSGEVTLLVIAHRLATIRNCDYVAYLDQGRLRALGKFNDVRLAIPDFDRQAELLGL